MTETNDMADKLDLADRLLRQGKYPEAIAGLEEIHTVRPGDESVLLRLAWAFWDSGDKERSVHYWEILLDQELQRRIFTGFAYDELVRIYKQEGATEKLVRLCEKVAGVQPEDVGILEELGKAYLLAGDNEKACAVFHRLTVLEADNPAYYCRLGEALLASQKIEAGEEAYRQAGLLDPEEADRYLLQAADLCLRGGRLTTARRLMAECLTLAPQNSLYYCFLGDILVALREPDGAFAEYEKACLYNRPFAAAYFNRLGHSLMKAELFADAAKAFEAALAFDESAPCRRHLEAAYIASGRTPSRG
ncbi:MAG: tetratricopeptide repeat protein [Deltaproteobacteria bacterium]|nr:tetratricopeptide repeat protein [Deltaproteobacteria bacterium]